MRKLMSVAIVCLMTLTLFGLFGGVVEEGRGEIVYDPSTNTIYINTPGSVLWYVNENVSNNIFWFDGNYYHCRANIQINDSADLTILSTDKLKIYNNTQLLYITVRGILNARGNNPLNPIIIDSDNGSTPSSGDWGGIKFLPPNASNSNLNFVYIANATKAIYCENSNPTITNSTIANNSKNGLYLINSNPRLFRNKIRNNGALASLNAGILFDGSSAIVEDCTLQNNKDYYLDVNNPEPISLNSTFSISNVTIFTGSLTVKWYLHVRVRDVDPPMNPIQGATVRIRDNNNGIFDQNYTTDPAGYIHSVLTQCIISSSGAIYYTPHLVNVTAEDYKTNSSYVNMDKSKEIPINLSLLVRDLVITNSDITFTNYEPIAGEEVYITFIVHNWENDTAENVRVHLYNDTYLLEEYIISKIEGKNFRDRTKKWIAVPGVHQIWVEVDPYNEIEEKNSTNPPIAELNNIAFRTIIVNAVPEVEITVPAENDSVKDTIDINGTAYDSPEDINDLTNVWISIDNLEDWQEAFIYPIPNPDGSHNWTYLWDTNQWNLTPILDGPHTIKAKAFDGNNTSPIVTVNVTVNNTGANTPPNAVISSPGEPNAFNVSDIITFDGSDSNDNQTSPENLIYAWDFYDKIDSNGDGNYTNDEDAFGNITTHAYDNKGFFNVTLTVTDEGGLNDTDSITIWIKNYLAVANITASDTTPYENDTITFNGSGSYDPDGIITSYIWNFDDGTILITIWPVVEVNHSFNESRIFNVTLTVTDNNVTSNTSWVLINVLANAAPTAFIDQPLNGQIFDVNETIIFNATSSSDPNDEDLEYNWDFGDGTTYLENDTYYPDGEYDGKTTHHYSESGPFPTYSYTITLEVRDDEGLSDTDTVIIIVQNYPPVAIATSNVTTAPTNQDITFNGTDSYDPEGFVISSYHWDFGDGDTSIFSIVDHSYAQDGIYNVTLTVTDNMGATDTDWIIITITNRPPIIENVIISPESPKMKEEFYINVTATDDGELVSYLWDFGDGNTYFENIIIYPDGAFDGNTNHSYSSKADFTVTITVEDDDGNTTSTELTITVENTPPEVNITFPTEGQTVSESITIQGEASDFDGSVEKVEVRIDSGTWILANDNSGDWSEWSLPWDTEDGVTNGQHTIYARAYDSESNTDPPASVTVDVDNVPSSIIVTANLNPSLVDAGGTVQVYGGVTYNTGEPVADADVNISIQGEDVYWTTTTSANGQYSWDITAPDEGGSFIVRVDVTKDSFSDFDRQTLTVTSLPDLVITASDIVFEPSDPSSGETVQITITVRNDGEEAANNVLVNAYDGDPAAGGDPIQPDDSDTISIVSAGGSKNVFLNWDTTDISGEHYIYIVLDQDDSIAESNENNNEASRFIDIQGQPDFTLDPADISFSKSDPKVDDKINIFVKIHNDGTESGTVKYEVYDGDPDTDGVIIDTGQESIPANDDKTVQVDWTIEKSGDHDIYVILDPDDDVDESDENNNKAHKPITVEALPGEGGVPSWLIGLTVVIVVVVFILIFFLRLRERGPKSEKELPMAKVVQKEAKEGEKGEEKKEEDKTLMESHGGVRI